MKTARQRVLMDFDQNMGALYPFSLRRKLTPRIFDTPPPERLTRAQAAPPVTIFQQDRVTGQMRPVADDRSLWR